MPFYNNFTTDDDTGMKWKKSLSWEPNASMFYFIYACPNLSRKHIQPLSKLVGKIHTVIG